MLIKEYRIPLPFTVDEFERAHRFSVVEASKNETGGGQGVEVLKDEPFKSDTIRPGELLKGTYTHKIYHLQNKASWFLRMLLPKEAMNLEEKSWNAYPYSKTVITNPDYMKKNFYIIVESMYVQDKGDFENALGLNQELLNKREVVTLDIFDDCHLKNGDVRPETDVRKFRSEKTNRGPLTPNWYQTTEPVMCAYKVCQVHFKWFGLQTKLERYLQSNYPRLFVKFHREIFCWMDKWYDLTMDDVRELEKRAAVELQNQLQNGEKRGMTAAEPTN